MGRLRVTFILYLFLVGLTIWSGKFPEPVGERAYPFAPTDLDQVDTFLMKMSDKERIAQLFIVKSSDSLDLLAAGFMAENLTSLGQVPREDNYGLPYLNAINLRDIEPTMFSESVLGRLSNRGIIEQYAERYGGLIKENGVNVVFGPSLNLYDDESDFQEYSHTFGSDPEDAAASAGSLIRGFEAAGIMSVVSGFPGTGSVRQGVANDHPTIYSSKKELVNHHMKPFKILVNNGLKSMCIDNAYVPAIDSSHQVMASISNKLNDHLTNSMGYKGLIWVDASSSDQPLWRHFSSGAHLMVIEGRLEDKVEAIQLAIDQGVINKEDIDNRVRNIIQSKIWIKTNQLKSLDGSSEIDVVSRQVLASSMVLLRNELDMLPLSRLDTTELGVVNIGVAEDLNLPWLAHRYSPAKVHYINSRELEAGYNDFSDVLQGLNKLVIIAEPEDGLPRKRFGMSMHLQSVIERIAYRQQTVLVWKGNPKALVHISGISTIKAVVSSHQESDLVNDFIIQAVFGGRPMDGVLRRNVGDDFDKKFGINTNKTRLAHGIPEEVGVRSVFLNPIDSIVNDAIAQKATPGAQVWFAKDKMVIFNKTYGHHRYDEKDTVRLDDLYDLASITKIAGSVAGLMKLANDSLFNLDYNLCDYLGEWVDTTEYMNLGMREILAHQAGLPAFIPFYLKTLQKGVPRFDVYSLVQNDVYSYRVARELYIHHEQPDKMFRQILTHNLSVDKKYKYSDVGYYFMLRIIEKQSGNSMDEFLDDSYYRPLGLSTMTYRPLEKFPKNRILPTELDRYFRNQLIHGDVHDPGSAMLGGVGGHAGLFSNANDLGTLMQLYLNEGEYGGERYFDSTIIKEFVRCQFCENDNRRGAGFDKPLTDGSAGPTCGCTDLNAFGHQGFTGTATWADPQDNSVYVFLSNRVYPSAENRKLAQMNVRTDVQKIFHKAVHQSSESMAP